MRLSRFDEEELIEEQHEPLFEKLNISRFNVYMEDGDDTDVEETTDETEENENTDSDETESVPDETDASNDDGSDTDAESDNNNDLSNFGNDDSDVQNEFDSDEIEIINKLIASESEAINDYFDASKDSRDDSLRRLYGDIGHEERFHLEQLLYAKSTLTGEKYEPRDPDVKTEFESLLRDGMDEDTAAVTAIDKTSLNDSDDGDDSDMEELEQESVVIENMLINNEILTEFCLTQCELAKANHIINKSTTVILEAYFQEEMDNVAQAPKEVRKIQSPVKIMAKGLKMAVNGLLRLSSVTRDAIAKNKMKNYRKKEWIKNHGIADLFKNGIHLYFYSDKINMFDAETPCRYVDLLYRLTKDIGNQCGIKLTQAAKHQTVKDPVRYSSIKEGIDKLNNVVLTKTKVVVTDKNKDAITREFFGYSDQKLGAAMTHGKDDTAVRDSANVYNKLDLMILITKEYVKVSEAVLGQLQTFEGDVNSIYYKNRKAYNTSVDDMKVIVSKYDQFIKAMAHDLKVIVSLDNGLLKMTRERDKVEQTGGQWEGQDIRVSRNNMNNQNKYVSTRKGLFNRK